MSFRRRNHRFASGFFCVCAVFPALPAVGGSTGVTPRGGAEMQAMSAKIDTPYPNAFIFSTDRADYPFLEEVDEESTALNPGASHVAAGAVYDVGPTGQNMAGAFAKSDGTFGSTALVQEWIAGYDHGYSGVLSETYWWRAYRITDADIANIQYTVSEARLSAYVLGGSVHSELVFDINLYIPSLKDGVYSNTHEQAGIFALAQDNQVLLEEGPLTYLDSRPQGYGSRRMSFDSYTGNIDVSGLLDGQIVYVEYIALTAVSYTGFEVSQGEAFFMDPISGSGGFGVQVAGLEQVPEPAPLALLALLVGALAARR